MMVIYTIIVLGLLIFVHEGGHFTAAKLLGVKVNEFALGMGPVIFKRQKGETQYSLRAVPIGGFCAMEGEDEEKSDDPRAFTSKPAWARAIILVAGPLMNVVLCFVIVFLLLLSNGQPTTTLGSVDENGPAYAAGLRAGDTILSIDGTEISAWNDVGVAMNQAQGDTVIVEVKRNGEVLSIESGYVYDESRDRNLLGINSKPGHNPVTAFKNSFSESWGMVRILYKSLAMLITGELSINDFSGPVGITYAVGETASHGFKYLVYFVAFLSMNLAVVNLLPLPALDGGRLLFTFVRVVTRGRFTDKVEAKINLVGMLLLFSFMIYITWNDIGKLILGKLNFF